MGLYPHEVDYAQAVRYPHGVDYTHRYVLSDQSTGVDPDK